ncbi:DUF881 domain-containing protein [Clostridium cadaveris]|uniref:DUF881 domain-containing protein n=1 Tax=Clostridium cadaveris TaxID=1529 RepID=UPI0031DFCA7F
MKKNEGSIFVFIASIVIGLLISLNIHFGTQTETVILNTKQYQDAYMKKRNLYQEVANLKDTYHDLNKKLQQYESKDKDNTKVMDTLNDELNKNLMILGYSKVKGQGIEMTLTDGLDDFNNSLDDNFYSTQRIIHNTDVLNIVNELKGLGVEAIAINSERIVNSSEINCSGGFISINSVKYPMPFYIYAIGDKDVLKDYLLNNNESYIRLLINRGIKVSIEAKDEITMPKYLGDIKIKYLIQNYK